MTGENGRFSLAFVHPEPAAEKRRILPLFLPFAGCRRVCLFCAQETQTGRTQEAVPLILKQAESRLRDLAGQGPPPEAAFYGGTFTALREEDFAACLSFTRRMQAAGMIAEARCSTRPDAVSPALLDRLLAAGFTCVELGVQSFSSAALAGSGRGYSRETALAACHMVRRSGLNLGIQLMPGLPGADLEAATRDVAQAATLAPACVRLYPCLVLEDSGLASLWRGNLYIPWEEGATLAFLAEACLTLWAAGVRVIRQGLAPQRSLLSAILAGPWHPALGARARGLALALFLERRLAEAGIVPGTPLGLDASRRYQGEFWGHRGELA
ncbi:MAG: radical SAM protein, partial [Desulfovibrio sp.]|nr:radical SAM protein [Desulfovibrio sp.]